MKTILLLFTVIALQTSCYRPPHYGYYPPSDSPFYDTIALLHRYPKNKKAAEALPRLYQNAAKKYLDIIERQNNGSTKTDSLIYAYEELQKINRAVLLKDVSSALITTTNYSAQLNRLYRDKTLSEYREQERLLTVQLDEYSQNTDSEKWNNLLNTYKKLESLNKEYRYRLNDTSLLKPVDYTLNKKLIYEDAAAWWYNNGITYLGRTGRKNARSAYDCFVTAEKWISGYRDCQAKKDQAWEQAVVHVLVLPVQDNSFFFTTGWRYNGNERGNEYFQQVLVRELNELNSYKYPAKFYTPEMAAAKGVRPEWTANLYLDEMKVPATPEIRTSTDSRSRSVAVGTDTSGITRYQTVTGYLYTTTYSLYATAALNVRVNHSETGSNIYRDHNTVSYSWKQEVARYEGDTRALNDSDRDLLNRPLPLPPYRETIVNELTQKLYDDALACLKVAVKW